MTVDIISGNNQRCNNLKYLMTFVAGSVDHRAFYFGYPRQVAALARKKILLNGVEMYRIFAR
jgi:hypothetical protein